VRDTATPGKTLNVWLSEDRNAAVVYALRPVSARALNFANR